MNVESILKKVTNNWFAKCVCIIAAIILYLFGLTSRLEKRTFSIPLTVIEDGELIKTSSIQPTVSVTVRSNSKNIPNITSADIQASIDLSYFVNEGLYSAPIALNLSPEIVLVDPVELVVTPEYIPVKLEKRVRKSVPIKVPLAGEPLHGYEVEKITVNPDFAIITGPRSIVEKISQIQTEEVVVTEKKDNFSVIQKVRNPNRHVKLLEPARVTVVVSLDQFLTEKKFDNYFVSFENLNPKFQVDVVQEVSFKVSGTQLILEQFYPEENSVQVDCSSIEEVGEYELPVKIIVDDHVKIVEQSVENLKFVVKEKTLENQNEQQKQIQKENLKDDLKENSKENILEQSEIISDIIIEE